MTSVEARKRFSELLDTAQREPIAITRHGSPAAFVISARDMKELLNARQRRSKAVAEMEAWSARAKKRATAAAGRLSDEELNQLVHESRVSPST